jgi:hypothetical protein
MIFVRLSAFTWFPEFCTHGQCQKRRHHKNCCFVREIFVSPNMFVCATIKYDFICCRVLKRFRYAVWMCFVSLSILMAKSTSKLPAKTCNGSLTARLPELQKVTLKRKETRTSSNKNVQLDFLKSSI